MAQTFTGDQLTTMGLPDWRPIGNALETRFRTRRFDVGLALVNDIAVATEEMNHHPDLDLRYGHLNVRLFSHDASGCTQRDVDLARAISALAAERGVEALPSAVARLEVALDTWDAAEIRPFWQAVLGLESHPDDADELIDLAGALPGLWFQETQPHAEPPQRFHLDLVVPPEVAVERIAAGVAAGGRIVDDSMGPRWVVLADPQGNKVCICTHIGRGI